ncbi:thioredoxin-like protein [Polychytrium aggregatum]|uniref:thioredoxin-like protein n=1 Tax=Polychytrium aggregatum TaxID=110093 RepID=UPI0022FF40BB|nr:thioredoxin-like protein [Polychytrium aggregatum]KAI9207952.1 thioredoxin-like protein [Polychytrium aggregatum]
MSAAKTLQKLLSENTIVVISKSWCPYCRAAKQRLQQLNLNFLAVEIDSDPEGLQAYIRQTYNHSTVPAIFIHAKLLGGNSDLQAHPNIVGLVNQTD